MFNQNLKKVGSSYTLDTNNLNLFQLYMAKKNGMAKDDFPGKHPILISIFTFLLIPLFHVYINHSLLYRYREGSDRSQDQCVQIHSLY
jgi:hypothetical protein